MLMEEFEQLKMKLESLISPEEISRQVEELANKEAIRKEMNETVKSHSYWQWLTSYVDQYGSVHNSTSFSTDSLTDEDYENINHLDNLFDVVSSFASSNYFYPDENDYSSSYDVKYNGEYYTVGCNYGQGSFCFVEKKESSGRYIDFNYIIDGKDLPDKEYIEEQLDMFTHRLNTLINLSVPIEALKERFDATYTDAKKYVRK
jgi:hypothetical protein